MCFYCHDKVVIKGKEVYYPFQLLALAFTSLVKPSHHPLVHLATMTQWYHFLTSYPVSPFPPVKLRTPFVQPCSNDSRPLRHLQILLTVFTLYLQTRIVLCSPRKCSLDPAALSSCCSVFFFPFTVKLFNFQISSLYLLPPFFPLTYSGIRLLFLLLCKKRISHPHSIIITANLC